MHIENIPLLLSFSFPHFSNNCVNKHHCTDHTDDDDQRAEGSTQDPVCKPTPIANNMSCKEADTQPVPSTSGHSASLSVPSTSGHTSLPRAPPRKKKSVRTRQGSTSVTIYSR